MKLAIAVDVAPREARVGERVAARLVREVEHDAARLAGERACTRRRRSRPRAPARHSSTSTGRKRSSVQSSWSTNVAARPRHRASSARGPRVGANDARALVRARPSRSCTGTSASNAGRRARGARRPTSTRVPRPEHRRQSAIGRAAVRARGHRREADASGTRRTAGRTTRGGGAHPREAARVVGIGTGSGVRSRARGTPAGASRRTRRVPRPRRATSGSRRRCVPARSAGPASTLPLSAQSDFITSLAFATASGLFAAKLATSSMPASSSASSSTTRLARPHSTASVGVEEPTGEDQLAARAPARSPAAAA